MFRGGTFMCQPFIIKMTFVSQLLALVCLTAFVSGHLAESLTTFNQADSSSSARIIGGVEAPENSVPYQVSLVDTSGLHFCSGAIISVRYIITVAHCIHLRDTSKIFAVVGTQDLKKDGDRYSIASLIVHEYYMPATMNNDIGLLKTSLDIKLSGSVKTIFLAKDRVLPNSTVTVSGWGTTKHDIISDKLQVIRLKTIDLLLCRIWLQRVNQVYDYQICTYTKEGEGPCLGDSGGPLVYYEELAGLVSWGKPCARGFPDVFTGIYGYIDWIHNNTLS